MNNEYTSLAKLQELIRAKYKQQIEQDKALRKRLADIVVTYLPIIRAELALQMFKKRGQVAGRPQWEANAASTVKRKGFDKPLIESGSLMRMMSDPANYAKGATATSLHGTSFNDSYTPWFAAENAIETTLRFRNIAAQFAEERTRQFPDFIKTVVDHLSPISLTQDRVMYKLNSQRPFIDIGSRPEEKKWILDKLMDVIRAQLNTNGSVLHLFDLNEFEVKGYIDKIKSEAKDVYAKQSKMRDTPFEDLSPEEQHEKYMAVTGKKLGYLAFRNRMKSHTAVMIEDVTKYKRDTIKSKGKDSVEY